MILPLLDPEGGDVAAARVIGVLRCQGCTTSQTGRGQKSGDDERSTEPQELLLFFGRLYPSFQDGKVKLLCRPASSQSGENVANGPQLQELGGFTSL
ncbi:MAG TPA: hypothetical protein PLI43_07535 [Albidovulum sp.]|uniref:hypothetical protein n=1 Tax=Albidovulum sp. TaxID=1872424 RepID=UPI002C59DC05|nr:hypothetical protein [Albidovulum sp.]